MHTSTTITRISGKPYKYILHSSTEAFGPFSHIILATPAPISSSLLSTLSNPNLELCNALGAFKYVPTLVVTHTDPSFVPSFPSLQRDLHFQRPSTPVKTLQALEGYVQATHILHHRSPHLQSLKVYQTTNPHCYPRKGTILSQTWFKRYLPTLESLRTKDEVFSRHGWGQGRNNIWFVGSWCGEGIPLLEGCVESAENVIDEISYGVDRKMKVW
jgi:predicted NAD/FAD-binding protein